MGHEDVGKPDGKKCENATVSVSESSLNHVAGQVHFPQMIHQQLVGGFAPQIVNSPQVRSVSVRPGQQAGAPVRSLVAVPVMRQPNNVQFVMNGREFVSPSNVITIPGPYVLQRPDGNSFLAVHPSASPMSLVQIQGQQYVIPGNQMVVNQGSFIPSSNVSSINQGNTHAPRDEEKHDSDDAQEMPPALDLGEDDEEVCDENKEVTLGFSCEKAFHKEAEVFRKTANNEGIVLHDIEGYIIEESDIPLITRVDNRVNGARKSKQVDSHKKETQKDKDTNKESPHETDDGGQHEEKRRRRRNELTALLSMDFGPKSGEERILTDSKRRSLQKKEEDRTLDNQRRRSKRSSDEHSTHRDENDPLGLHGKEKQKKKYETNDARSVSVQGSYCSSEVDMSESPVPASVSVPTSSAKKKKCECEPASEVEVAYVTCIKCGCQETMTESVPQFCCADCRSKEARSDEVPPQLESHEKGLSESLQDCKVSTPPNEVEMKEEDEKPSISSSAEIQSSANMPDISLVPHSSMADIPIEEQATLSQVHPFLWTLDDTYSWVLKVTGSIEVAKLLVAEDIDGLVLFGLTSKELREPPLKMKFGPARKIEIGLDALCREWNIHNRFVGPDIVLPDKSPNLVSVEEVHSMVMDATNSSDIAARLKDEEIDGYILNSSSWDELKDLFASPVYSSNLGKNKKLERFEKWFQSITESWSNRPDLADKKP